MIRMAKAAVRALLRRFDVDLRRYSDTIRSRRADILEENGITLVLDAGANVGQYATSLRETGYAGRIVSFEPLQAAYAELEKRAASDDAWECRHMALGDSDGLAEINIAANSVSSSLLPMLPRHLKGEPASSYVGSQEVTRRRLDSLSSELVGDTDNVYLKLDVQGFEMQTLRGAAGTLEGVRATEVEMSVVPLYEGQALWHEVIAYLYSLGFELAWLERGFTDENSGRILQLDGIFVRGS